MSNSTPDQNKANKFATQITSPCVRNCCLNEKDICLGCFRHLDEITGWTAMSDQEKITTLNQCQKRKLNHHK